MVYVFCMTIEYVAQFMRSTALEDENVARV